MQKIKKYTKNKISCNFDCSQNYQLAGQSEFKKQKLDDYLIDSDNEMDYNQSMGHKYNQKTKSTSSDNMSISCIKEISQFNERTRLVSINEAFEILRVHIPTFPYERRLSKIDTLHLAISYISLLESVISSNMNLYDYLQSSINYSFGIFNLQYGYNSYDNAFQISKPLWATSDLTVRLNWLNWNNLGIDKDDVPKFLNLFQFFADFKR